MDEEGGARAPVTRLRRRMSVEQSDDGKSSSAPNTPTKKRGVRRAAKPELDLIDENAPKNDTPKTFTKKAIIKDMEVQEKPVTPSRRSTRIKSNTSIVLETTQALDSPRAKRASRRNSQVGSDNEAALTPARHTRQGRKDIANTDKGEPQQPDKPMVSITATIIEEPETSSQKSQSNPKKSIEHSQSPTGLRKSPRLSLKKNTISDSIDQNQKEDNTPENLKNNKSTDSIESNEKSDEQNNSYKENESTQDKKGPENVSPQIKLVDISNSLLTDVEINKLSISNVELLSKVNTELSRSKHLNKSSSALMDTQAKYFKNKRYRTKSWTALSDPVLNDNKCYSDSESTKKSKLTSSHNNDVEKESKDEKDDNKEKQAKETDIVDLANINNKTCPPITNPVNSIASNLFDREPTITMKTLVYIEESDSNSEKMDIHKQITDEDQCVPVVQTHFDRPEKSPTKQKIHDTVDVSLSHEKNATINNNDSCEPMDIDETIPDNSISNKSLLKTKDISVNKVSLKENNEVSYMDNEKDGSARSPLSFSTLQTLDKTGNENKSTLVLSQLKDISDENNQSQQIAANKSFSNTDQLLNLTQDNEIDKKSLALNYQTSTPLQQRNLIKHSIKVNSSDVIPNNTSEIDKSSPKKHMTNTKNYSNNDSEESEPNEELSQKESSFVDDEAEEASANYESGDSRDDEEEQYEREHEIIQKGETLTSEDELSNDSDYEKDSFVVSSDQEDNNLLDDSGDDLSMSDNELKMNAESKKKYNERMKKEQKKASREMYISRHKLNESNKSNKSDLTKPKKNRAVLDSSESEDENIQVKQKKYNRMRLDSSHDTSMKNSFEDTSKTQLHDLSKSVHDDNANEEEMTIIEDEIKGEIDPLLHIKKESKTPKKETENMSIQFMDSEESERKESDNNTQVNITQADDPLEASNLSDGSDSSANVHIENYDSILNDLNKSMNTKKSKKGDISLNIDKKHKQKSAPIVDQLNLTEIKLKKKKQNTLTSDTPSKKSSNDKPKEQSDKKKLINKLDDEAISKDSNISSKSVAMKEFKNNDEDNESSASIDLQLLFSEDSNNSEDVAIKHKKGENSNDDNDFIPLKKSHGKTDIFETTESNDKSQTESAKKKKKKDRGLNKSGVEIEYCDDETEVKLFVDTTGAHSFTQVDMSFKGGKKKNGKHSMEAKSTEQNETQRLQVDDEDIVNRSLDTLNKSKTKTPKSDKKKKKTESLMLEQTGAADTSINKSVSKTPKSEKKKARQMSEIQTDIQQEINSDSDAPLEVPNKSVMEAQELHVDIEGVINTSLTAPNKSLTKTPKSEKKKKKRVSETQLMEQTDTTEDQYNVKDDEAKVTESGTGNISLNKSMSKTPKMEKKKGKRMSEPTSVEHEDKQISPTELTVKKNKSAIGEQDIQDNIEEKENKNGAKNKSMDKSVAKTPKSAEKSKKKKKKDSISSLEIQILNEVTTETDLDLLNKQKSSSSVTSEGSATNKILTKTSRSEKKKHANVLESNNMGNVTESTEGSKKRKRKSSLNQTEKEPESEGPLRSTSQPDTNVPIATVKQNKKRKISHNIDDSENVDQAIVQNTKITKITKHRDIEKQSHTVGNQVNDKGHTTDVNLNDKKASKKRKEREGDEGIRTAKVQKVDTNDKLQVQRLPASILNHLEDRPGKKTHQVTKPKAISTTSFAVEETKVTKTKPSSYLEESIYLNEEEVLEPKKQKYVKNPKVLPFLPTVSTSNSGYTTNFRVNILPKEIKFVAKSSSVNNFKNDYLQNKKIKRLGTYEMYKKNRTIKMSKF